VGDVVLIWAVGLAVVVPEKIGDDACGAEGSWWSREITGDSARGPFCAMGSEAAARVTALGPRPPRFPRAGAGERAHVAVISNDAVRKFDQRARTNVMLPGEYGKQRPDPGAYS
jgi:hypothetical protein